MADILRILIKNGVVWDYIKYAPLVIKRGVLECIAQGGKCFPAAGGYTERVYAAIFCGMLKALIRNGGANAANIAGSIEFAPAKIIKAEQQSSPIRLLLDIHGRNAVKTVHKSRMVAADAKGNYLRREQLKKSAPAAQNQRR